MLQFRVYAILIFFSSKSRHTRLSWYWSSDVCSSDLMIGDHRDRKTRVGKECRSRWSPIITEIGRGSCRGRVEISGGAGSLKKKSIEERASVNSVGERRVVQRTASRPLVH